MIWMECAAAGAGDQAGGSGSADDSGGSGWTKAQQIVAACVAGTSAASAVLGTVRGQDGPATAGEDAGATNFAGATDERASGVADDGWDEEEMFALVRRAYPYRNLKRETFDSILEMLSEGIAARRGRYGAYVHRDRVNGKLRARRGARLAAITSGGAIPDNSLYTVVAEPDGVVVGTVDEDSRESNRGDIMLLGNTSWMIHRIENNAGRMLAGCTGAAECAVLARRFFAITGVVGACR